MINKYGYWIIRQLKDITDKTSLRFIKFHSKFAALYYATQAKTKNTDLWFWYHEDVFSKVDITQLGKISLDTLYKERAQQLRDKYDYLILYFSGGADSHNILKTFIDNNILLDEVCVKWPKPLMDNKFYTPNNLDTRANNIWSEWDYAVAPTLEWLKKYHPEIKITIKEYVDTSVNINKLFEENKNHGFRSGIIKDSIISDSEREQIDKGKTVGNIFGVDKPLLLRETSDSKVYMFFTDISLVTATRSLINPTGTEPFYWTADFPTLPFEQAYQLFLYYNTNKNLQKFLFTRKGEQKELTSNQQLQGQQELAKNVIYSNWDNRFQTKKKTTHIGTDMYSWIYETSELEKLKKNIVGNIVERSNMINDDFLFVDGIINGQTIKIPSTCYSKLYYIGELTP